MDSLARAREVIVRSIRSEKTLDAALRIFTTAIDEAHHNGANWMLDGIRGTLREYPNMGGDVEVMKQVERIVDEARLEKVAIVDKWIEEQRKEYPRTTAKLFNAMLDELAASLRERGKV